MSITVIGSNNTDLITYITRSPVEGETIEVPDFEIGFGGRGANQAVAAARLGPEVIMMTYVGDDTFGVTTIENLAHNGIDLSLVKQVHGISDVTPIFVGPDSHSRTIIVKGANNGLLSEDVEAGAHAISKTLLIVCQLEIHIETVAAAIALEKRLGIPVLLNPAPATKDLDLELVAQCAYVIPNESELELLTGIATETEEQVKCAARVLLEADCPNVIVTLGSQDVRWLSHTGNDVFTAPFSIDPVDTTGVGDAFTGCFAHCLSEGLEVREGLELTNAYVALPVTVRGTQKSYRDAQEFRSWLSDRDHILAEFPVLRR